MLLLSAFPAGLKGLLIYNVVTQASNWPTFVPGYAIDATTRMHANECGCVIPSEYPIRRVSFVFQGWMEGNGTQGLIPMTPCGSSGANPINALSASPLPTRSWETSKILAESYWKRPIDYPHALLASFPTH